MNITVNEKLELFQQPNNIIEEEANKILAYLKGELKRSEECLDQDSFTGDKYKSNIFISKYYEQAVKYWEEPQSEDDYMGLYFLVPKRGEDLKVDPKDFNDVDDKVSASKIQVKYIEDYGNSITFNRKPTETNQSDDNDEPRSSVENHLFYIGSSNKVLDRIKQHITYDDQKTKSTYCLRLGLENRKACKNQLSLYTFEFNKELDEYYSVLCVSIEKLIHDKYEGAKVGRK